MSHIPYAEALGTHDPQAVIAETPIRLARVLEGITDAQADLSPAPGKWCLREVIAHLADCEIAWGWRLRIAVEKDHAEMQPFDQGIWGERYSAYTFAAAKATYYALRAWNIALVSTLTEADKAKLYTHPERGEERLWTIVEIMAGHDLHHLKTLENL